MPSPLHRPAAASPRPTIAGSVATPVSASGWIEAAIYVVIIGALSLTYAVGHAMGASASAFILYAMLASAVAMLAYTGFGKDARAVMLHPTSFVLGFSIIAIEIFYYLVISNVPPAHGTLVVRIGLPIAMIAGAFMLGRRPARLAIAGALVIVATLAYVIAITAPHARWALAFWGTMTGTFMVVRGFAGEFHPWNRAARTVREKVRITGLVVLMASVLSLSLTALASAAIAAGLLPATGLVPTVSQLTHVPTILLGTLGGGAMLTAMAYLGFSSVVKITTENLTAMLAFAPVTSWMFQVIGVAMGLIVAESLEPRLVGAMAVVVVAVLLIFWAGYRGRARR